MRRVLVRLSVVVLLLACVVVAADVRSTKPPATRTDNVSDTLHGVTLTDPYRWLEDQNSPETRAWIDAQNAYTQAVLGTFTARDSLKKQVEQLLRIQTISTPFHRGTRYFFSRRRADQNLSVIYVRELGKDTVLVDPNPMTQDGSLSAIIMGISEDGSLISYGLRKGGADEVALHILDVKTRKPLPDTFPVGRYGSIQFTPDDKSFYYEKYTNGVGPRIYLHSLGADPSADKEIFGKQYGTGEGIGVDMTPDGRYLVFQVEHGSAAEQTEIYVQDLKQGGPITPVVNDIKAEFTPELAGDKLFLETNWEAPNGRIFVVPLAHPERPNWKLAVPESEFPIQGTGAIGGRLFVSYLQNVVTHVKEFDTAGKLVREMRLPAIGSVNLNGRWEDDEAFYSFNSFAMPNTIYRMSVASGQESVWAKITLPVSTDDIETRQVWYESKDKTRIPMFLVYRKGTPLDGSRPTLLTGYGGFRISRTASYSALATLWALNGGVFALPNLRGGGEFGEKWHTSGMLANKQNVFDDFIGAAEWLIANRYTNAQKLAIQGASNGGLLVGAALTQRPDLFRAVVCGYPLLDMLRYDKFLVARFWVPEYGSADDAEQFKILRAYSPYHNVKPGTKYPATMFVTGDSDTRVAPLHARKMAALLQSANASDYPVVLHYDTRAGHSGGGAVSKQIDDMSDELSFIFSQLAMTPAMASGQKAGK